MIVRNYLIEGRNGDWIVSRLGEKKNKETGEVTETEADRHYFGKLHQAVLHVLNHRLCESSASNLEDILAVIREEASAIIEVTKEAERLLKEALRRGDS